MIVEVAGAIGVVAGIDASSAFGKYTIIAEMNCRRCQSGASRAGAAGFGLSFCVQIAL